MGHIRRPRPWPRQGRRLGPPEVWNLLCHGHGPHIVQGRSSNNCLSVFKRFAKPQRPQTRRGSSHDLFRPLLLRVLSSYTRHGHLFLREFKPAVFPASTLQTLPQLNASAICFFRAFKPAVCPPSNASNPSAVLSKATLTATHPGYLFFRAFKPAVCPLQTLPQFLAASLSKATLAATRPRHLFFRAFKPTVCPPSNASNPSAGLSKPAFCPPSNASNPSAGLSKATRKTLHCLFARLRWHARTLQAARPCQTCTGLVHPSLMCVAPPNAPCSTQPTLHAFHAQELGESSARIAA